MSQFASVDLPIILGGLAVVGSVGGTAIGVWLGSRREHQHWLRTERARAYAGLYEAVQRGITGSPDGAHVGVNDAAGPVILLGPSSVSELVGPLLMSYLRYCDALATDQASTERALATYLAAERRFLIAASHALGAILPRENWLTSRLDEDDECPPDDAGSQVG